MERLPALPSLGVLALNEAIAGPSRLEQIGMLERVMRRYPELIREASEASDLVILDTPPLSEVSDGLRILPSADCVLLVARLHHTKRSELARCEDLLHRVGRTPLGIVLIAAGPKYYALIAAGPKYYALIAAGPKYYAPYGTGVSDRRGIVLDPPLASKEAPARTGTAPR